MPVSPGHDPVPHAPSSQDVAALIGVLAVLEGESLIGSLEDRFVRRVGDRFARVGLLAEPFDIDGVRQAVNDMNHRLRHALGEDDGSPA